MTVYYAQNGDAELTLYKEIATIFTTDRKIYEFNEEGISADYWVVRFTSSGWIDLRLCSPIGLFTTGLYTKECYEQIMDRVNGSTSGGNYQPKGNYVTTDTTQSISGQKTFDTTPILSKIKGAKVLGTNASGAIEAHSLGIGDITNLGNTLEGMMTKSTDQTITGTKDFNAIRRHSPYLYLPNENRLVRVGVKANGTLYVNNRNPKSYSWDVKYLAS